MPHPLTGEGDSPGRMRLCICHGAPERPYDGDMVEDCPVCGNMRLARPPVSVASAMLRATDEDAPREVQGPPVGASISGALRQMAAAKPDLLVIPPALEACARQISGPDKCPVCQGRYPNEAAELAFREEVEAEAFYDCREDLAEALGLEPAEQDTLEDLFAKVRELREANEIFASQVVTASNVEHFRAGQDAGLQEAHDVICEFAEGLASKADKSPALGPALQTLMVVAGLVRDRANALRDGK